MKFLCLAFAFALIPASAFAQAAPPAFDVVSIKPNNSGTNMIRIMFGDDRCEMSNVTVGMMMMNAFDLKPSQLAGLPAWANSDHFDVQCKLLDADKEALKKMKPEDRRPMYQALLKDRFGLQYHMETKNLPVYELVVNKGGPKITALAPQTDAEKQAERDPSKGPIKPGMMGRGSMMSRREADGFTLEATGVKMLGLASMLSNQAGRIVLDKTDLTGEYTFKLRWAPENVASAPAADNGSSAEVLPSIFTAVQEQLGLRLVASKGDIPILTVDHLDRPSDN